MESEVMAMEVAEMEMANEVAMEDHGMAMVHDGKLISNVMKTKMNRNDAKNPSSMLVILMADTSQLIAQVFVITCVMNSEMILKKNWQKQMKQEKQQMR